MPPSDSPLSPPRSFDITSSLRMLIHLRSKTSDAPISGLRNLSRFSRFSRLSSLSASSPPSPEPSYLLYTSSLLAVAFAVCGRSPVPSAAVVIG